MNCLNKFVTSLKRMTLWWWILCLFSVLSSASFAVPNIESFFANPETISAEISPSGEHIVSIVSEEDKQSLVIYDTKNHSRFELLDLKDLSDNQSKLQGAIWIDNKHIAVQFVEVRSGIRDLLDTQHASRLLIIALPEYNSTPVIYAVKTPGWLIDPLNQEHDYFLYAKNGLYSKVYKVKVSKLNKYKAKLNKLTKIDGGQFKKNNEIASTKGFVMRWFFGLDGKVKSVLKYNEHKEIVLSTINDDGQWLDEKTWDANVFSRIGSETDRKKMLIPFALSDEADIFYSLDLNEPQERSVYKVNFKSSYSELVYESDSYKIIELLQDKTNNELIGVKVLKDGYIQNVFLSREDQDDPIITDSLKPEFQTTIGASQDDRFVLSYFESHDQPGLFILEENESEKTWKIGSMFPELDDRLDSRLIEKHIEVEGLDVAYLLSLPGKSDGQPFPLIVMPHGGPIGVFDTRFFDPITQYFVAHGFAVLRVNYRGSSGYSEALREAGTKQWGNLILEDIYQASLDVMGHEDISSSEICIFGASYGGYAASMLPILHPDTYRCAVNVSGVSDINLHVNSAALDLRKKRWLEEYVGNPQNEYDKLKLASPAFRVADLQTPILVMHGVDDKIVDIEHFYRLKLMLEKYNKPHETFLFEETGHHFEDPKTRAMMFEKTKAFIEEHIRTD